MRSVGLAVAVAAVMAAFSWGCGSSGSGQAGQKEVTLGATAPKPPPEYQRQRRIGTQRPRSRQTTGAPAIKPWPISFPARRKQEMAAYSQRHYGRPTYRLTDPRVIVEHYTESSTAQAAYNTFAPDTPDVELHELPGVCSHFVVDKDGTIFQLVPVSIMCRHTVGLNWTAVGIEHVGSSDAEILENPRQLSSSLELTRWLRCRFAIKISNVIGHNESLSSPYHHELVPSLRRQTHSDWTKSDMDVYRARLRALSC